MAFAVIFVVSMISVLCDIFTKRLRIKPNSELGVLPMYM